MYYSATCPELDNLITQIQTHGSATESQVRDALNPYLGNRTLIDWLIYESEYDDRDDYRYCPLFDEDADPEILIISLAVLKNVPIWVVHVIYNLDWQNPDLYPSNDYLDYVVENLADATTYEMNKRRAGLALLVNYQYEV